ncbi:hypothetical protein ACO9S2_02230 [Nitrospira sp. NS4]|uniref:hypothetical protein n=1 Tax=Nitrospira sp. NS4 TaxID=3414498 RepID=UPI003C2BB3CE
MSQQEPRADDLSLSLVRGDPWFRLQRAIGLVPPTGLGIIRRCLVFALVTWLPLAIWALLWQRAFPGEVEEPLLRHFGVHVRCLIAIPLFIIAELVGDLIPQRVIAYFVSSGLVTDETRPRFVQIVRAAERLRDAWPVWAGMAASTLLFVTVERDPGHLHELVWASAGNAGTAWFEFGSWWFLFVVRPVFIMLLLAWVWRLVVYAHLLRQIARLPLQLVPTHPDRAGGLGFLEEMTFIFSPVVFAMSAVIASRWGHEVLYHEVDVHSLMIPLALFVVAMLVLYLGPLALFFRSLLPLKRQGLLEYGALVGRHGRLVRKRWIAQEPVVESPLLQAGELGPVIDTVSMYEVVAGIRPTPIGKRALLAIVLPALLPMIPVFAIQIPVKDMLLKLLTTLV